MDNFLVGLRKKQNISRKDLANKVGISEVSITRYENGDRRPTVDVLPKYAEALDCSIEELIGALPERKGA